MNLGTTLSNHIILMITQSLIILINNSNYLWIFRLHPRTTVNENQIISYLDDLKVDKAKYQIEDAIKTPLPRTLARAFVHITNFSGCLIEARMMGIPTILINDFGKEVFENYIDDDLVYFIDPKASNFELQYFSAMDKIIKTQYCRKEENIANPLYV